MAVVCCVNNEHFEHISGDEFAVVCAVYECKNHTRSRVTNCEDCVCEVTVCECSVAVCTDVVVTGCAFSKLGVFEGYRAEACTKADQPLRLELVTFKALLALEPTWSA